MNADAAYVELAEAKKAVRASRRAFAKSPDSVFVRTMKAVMDRFRANLAQGVGKDEAIAEIERDLRAAWPKSVSKFRPNCDACEDTGYVEHWCWHEQRCGREVCAKNPERQHAYVTFCHCPKGDKKRPRTMTPEDGIAAAVKTQKKRGFSRIGS
jgi:hypothetical protein